MLRWYGYVGFAMIVLAQLNFIAKIEPFATWYIPIVWFGYIFLVDSLVYRLAGRSLISNYPMEFLFLVVISVPFWSLFEFYNLFTLSWHYINYIWYVHLFDFTTIMPAVLETFSLFHALGMGKSLDAKGEARKRSQSHSPEQERWARNMIKVMIILGAVITLLPFAVHALGFPFLWLGLFLLLDPLNYLLGLPSLIQKVSIGEKSMIVGLFAAGITMGFFWEFWNYQAYPQWMYTFSTILPNVKLFEMPIFGYLGYLPFALEVFLFYALFRSLIFKHKNDVLAISSR